MPKNWCFWFLEKTLESPLDSKEIKPVNPKGNQSWIFIGRTDAEAEAPILWPLDAKYQLTGKDPHAGKEGRKRMTEDEMVWWHHRLNGLESGQTLEDGEGQQSLVCCSPWGRKESDMIGQLNNSTALPFETLSYVFSQGLAHMPCPQEAFLRPSCQRWVPPLWSPMWPCLPSSNIPTLFFVLALDLALSFSRVRAMLCPPLTQCTAAQNDMMCS